MNDNKIKYFSTGEFARLCRVNKKTLFHYDEIGLFKPDKILDNGYRYYSEYQLEVFDFILALRDIGMPLKEIKGLIDTRNITSVLEVFEFETNKITEEIKKLQRTKQMIGNKIKTLHDSFHYTEQIIIQEQEEESLILSNPLDGTKEPYDMENYMAHLDYCYANELAIGYPVGAMLTKEKLEQSNYYKYDYYYTKTDRHQRNEKLEIKPKGLYVVGYIRGYYDKTPLLYDKIMKYIKAHNLCIIGNAYEDVLVDAVATKEKNDYMIKASIQIQER